MAGDPRHEWETQATKLTLTGVFLASLAAFSTRVIGRDSELRLRPIDLVLIGLSSFRAGRIIAFERIGAPLREPFTETKPDESGAGETVVAEGRGVRFALGELLSCPICVGTWVAAGLIYGLHLLPRPTRVFISIMSATGVAEIIYDVSEALAWLGRLARKHASG